MRNEDIDGPETTGRKLQKKTHTHIQKKSLTLFSPILVFSLNKKDQTGHDIT